MKIRISIAVLTIFLAFQSIHAQDPESILIGQKSTIHSQILNEDRTILISLPDSYSDTTSKTYPILVLLDGYAHFKTTAGIVHFMSYDRLRNRIIPEMIIVAIENVDRERDFTVTKLKTKRENTMGGGKNFLAFIENELIPHMDKNYKTEPHRILAGHSLGGQLAVNAFMVETSLFNAFIAIDPSIWWDEKTTAEKVDSMQTEAFKKRIYIATANQGEAGIERNKKRHELLVSLFEKKAEGKQQVKLDYYDNENHRSIPLIAIYEGLKFLYKTEN